MSRWVESRGWATLLLLLAVGAQAAEPMRFDFAAGGNASGHPAYDASRGFGFEPGSPQRFSVRVPEGNYHLRLHFARQPHAPMFTLKSEQRRLMLENLVVGQRRDQTVGVTVNVRQPDLPSLPANATGGTRVALKPREIGALNWDDKLTLEFPSGLGALKSIELVSVELPTLYLAGDSTVTDQPVAPSGSWGQFLPRYFSDRIVVANHAESGETLKSFVTEHRLDKLLATLRTGDWVMIQFGHNDQKSQWPQTYADAGTTYRSWLRTYIAEIRRRGATPLLVTAPERRNFDAQGRITPTLGDYPDAMRAVAREENAALIDLNPMSVRFYEALGPDRSPQAFADQGRDRTHHNDYGAQQLARMVIEGLRSADPALTAGLATHIAPDAGRIDPANPSSPIGMDPGR
jgi:lysophospholipase L1-like esterase